MVRAKLRFSGEGPDVVTREILFVLPPFASDFDVSPDGQTFVFSRSLELKKFDPLSLIVNWEGLLE
jgi:hypothetical protein